MFLVLDFRVILEGNFNRELSNFLLVSRWDSLNEVFLFFVKVNLGEFCGVERGENCVFGRAFRGGGGALLVFVVFFWLCRNVVRVAVVAGFRREWGGFGRVFIRV